MIQSDISTAAAENPLQPNVFCKHLGKVGKGFEA